MTTEPSSPHPIRASRVFLVSAGGALLFVLGTTLVIFGILDDPGVNVPVVIAGALVVVLSVVAMVLVLRRMKLQANSRMAEVVETESAWTDTEKAVRIVLTREPAGLSQQAMNLANAGLITALTASSLVDRGWGVEEAIRATLAVVGISIAVGGYVWARRRGRRVALFPGDADPFVGLNLATRKRLARQLTAKEPPTLESAPLVLLTAQLQNVRSRAILPPIFGMFLSITAYALSAGPWIVWLVVAIITALVVLLTMQQRRLRRATAAARELLGVAGGS